MPTQRVIGIVKLPHGRTIIGRSEVDAVRVGDEFDVEQSDPTGNDWLWAIRTRTAGSHVAYARWADGAVPTRGVLKVTAVKPGPPGSGRLVEDFTGVVTAAPNVTAASTPTADPTA